jgi:predicted MFS family arabinose efflux permease
MSWLEDIFHEIGTVVPWLVVWFGVSAFIGYALRGSLSSPWFRGILFLVGGILSLSDFFALIPEHLELGFVVQLFLFFFIWGMVIGFENQWIPYKNLFFFDFWFPVRGKSKISSVFFQKVRR